VIGDDRHWSLTSTAPTIASAIVLNRYCVEAAATVGDVVDPVVDCLLDVLEIVADGALTVLDNVNGLVGRPVDVVCALVVDADGDVVGAWVGSLKLPKPFRGFAVECSSLVFSSTVGRAPTRRPPSAR